MARLYAGLDVSDKTTRICVVDAQGAVVHEGEVASAPIAIARELKPYRALLERVGQESGSLSQWLHKELSRQRYPMVCLDARAAHRVLSLQRAQTDVNDARGLAQALRANWYAKAHIRSDEAQRLRLLLIHRSAMKRKALDLEHSLRMSVKALGARMSARKGGTITVKQISGRQDRDLTRLSQGLVRAREALMSEVAQLDEVVRATAKSDPVCRRLMTVPGVGPITALAFRTGVDDPARFRSSRSVGAYFGLTPRRFQSGACDYSVGISKLGDGLVRSALFEAAFVMIANSKSECALRAWALRLRAKKGWQVACVALARRLAVILHRMWVSERDFDPSPAKEPHGRRVDPDSGDPKAPLSRGVGERCNGRQRRSGRADQAMKAAPSVRRQAGKQNDARPAS